MSDFTFWSDVSTVISYTYSSSPASHAFLRRSLPPFLCIPSTLGTRWPAPKKEKTGVRVREVWHGVSVTPSQWGQSWGQWRASWSSALSLLRFEVPRVLPVFIHSNTSFAPAGLDTVCEIQTTYLKPYVGHWLLSLLGLTYFFWWGANL